MIVRRYRARKRKGREERLSIVRVRKWDCKEKKKKTLGIAFDRFARSRDLLLCRKWSDISSPWRDIETKYIKKKKKNVKIKEKIRGIFASRQLATSFCSRLNASTCAYPPSLQSPSSPRFARYDFCCEGSKKIETKWRNRKIKIQWLQRVNDKDSSGSGNNYRNSTLITSFC